MNQVPKWMSFFEKFQTICKPPPSYFLGEILQMTHPTRLIFSENSPIPTLTVIIMNQIEWDDESGEVMIGTIPHIKVRWRL